MEVLLAGEGALGADHRDASVAGRLDRGLCPRGDHPDDGDVEALAGGVQRRRGGGVAGDDHELDVLAHQVLGDPQRELAHLVLVARAVGEVGEVGEVEQPLTGTLAAQLAEHGEPADAGIEDADGTDVTHRGRG